MEHVLCDVEVFSSYDTVNVPLFVPDVVLTETQLHVSETVHETLDSILTEYDPAEYSRVIVSGFNVIYGPAPCCVNVCISDSPSPATVIVHVLEDVEVFSLYVTVKLSSFEPDDGLIVTQLHISDTDHETLEETDI